MSVNNCIKKFGDSLKDRIDPDLIDYALDYINHSENVLAFETLCDHIADFNVKISEDEYNIVLHIVDTLGLDLDNRFLYINPNK